MLAHDYAVPTFRFSGGLSPREHLPRKGSNSPAHAHRRYWPAVLRAFNTYHKCTGVCRFVRGIPVGIARRVADLWGFCGARQSPTITSRRHHLDSAALPLG